MVAPLVFDVAFEFGAGVAVCDEACFASVDLEAGPVESSAFGEGGDGVASAAVDDNAHALRPRLSGGEPLAAA